MSIVNDTLHTYLTLDIHLCTEHAPESIRHTKTNTPQMFIFIWRIIDFPLITPPIYNNTIE